MEAIKLCRLDTPIIFIEARINLSRFVVTGCAAKTSATVTFPSLNLISLFAFCFNIWLNVFFFQAEDGIRDIGVTGVQTCTLPISRSASAARSAPNSPHWRIEPGARFSTQALPLMTIRERRRARSMKLRGSERTPWPVYRDRKSVV